jgi:hypothetical protein
VTRAGPPRPTGAGPDSGPGPGPSRRPPTIAGHRCPGAQRRHRVTRQLPVRHLNARAPGLWAPLPSEDPHLDIIVPPRHWHQPYSPGPRRSANLRHAACLEIFKDRGYGPAWCSRESRPPTAVTPAGARCAPGYRLAYPVCHRAPAGRVAPSLPRLKTVRPRAGNPRPPLVWPAPAHDHVIVDSCRISRGFRSAMVSDGSPGGTGVEAGTQAAPDAPCPGDSVVDPGYAVDPVYDSPLNQPHSPDQPH